MKHAIKVATRVVAFVSLAAVMSGCITERQAASILRKDAQFAPEIFHRDNYRALGARLDNLEVALNSVGVDCAIPIAYDNKDPGKKLDTITCTNKTIFTEGVDRPTAIVNYVERRNAQIDGLCDAYLGSLSSIGDTSRWSRTQINALADISSVVMGLAEAPASQLAYLAAGKSLINQSVDNLESYLLLSPSAEKLTQLVRTAQAKKREDKAILRQIADDGEQWTESSLWVQNYAMLCTPRGIRGLLNEAIDLRAPISEAGARQVAVSLGERMEKVLRGYAKNDASDPQKWTSLKDPIVLGALAWYVREHGKLNDEERSFFAAKVGDELAVFLPTLVQDSTTLAVINAELDASAGRYDELIRMAKMAQATGSATTRTQAAEDAAQKATQLALSAQKQASEAKADNAAAQKTITQMQAQLNQTVTQLSETNAALEKTVAERDALQKKLEDLKPE